jgi:HAD superfamily hydrolase (TIGR01549 family)
MRDYKYYLFDADGTLIDTTELICKCFENTARMTGNSVIEKTDILRHIGLTLKDQMAIHFGNLEPSVFEEYRKIHMQYQMTIYKEYLRLFNGVYETLATLKSRGKKCAIVTSRFKNSLEIYLRETGVVSFFDVIVTPESTEFHKPHPAPALKAMEQLNALPEESLYIGDATFDIECGSNAGVDTAFVLWSINEISSLRAKPTYCIKEMNELCEVLPSTETTAQGDLMRVVPSDKNQS